VGDDELQVVQGRKHRLEGAPLDLPLHLLANAGFQLPQGAGEVLLRVLDAGLTFLDGVVGGLRHALHAQVQILEPAAHRS